MRVLVADDDPISRVFIESSLQSWGFEPILCADGMAASRVLASDHSPSIAILDWQMPGIDGVQLCRQIRFAKTEPYKYVVLLTSKSREHNLIEGLEAGADDYISKPFDPSELKARLQTGRRIIQLQEDLIQSREALRFEATHDHLTGLLNRSAILHALHQELKRAKREGTQVSVAVADVDLFKDVNDTFGHACGDKLLRAITSAMQQSLRGYDGLGRFGGEEFLCVLPDCSTLKAVRLANRLRETVAATSIEFHNTAIRTTLSIGVAATTPESWCDSLDLIHRADTALYAAKQEGRNRVVAARMASAVTQQLQ